MKDDLRLDRAFAETPPEIHDAIERAFERGKEDMKKRTKVTLALGTAACLAFLLAAALAVGGLNTSHTDTVAAPGLNAVPEESAEVYFTEQGRYYHSRIDCSGMRNARPGTEEEAWSLNKRPCPVCMGGEATTMEEEEEDWVFCTERGTYYHSNVHCSGMRGAREVKLSEATVGGKKPCPVCMAGGSEVDAVEDAEPMPTEAPFGVEENAFGEQLLVTPTAMPFEAGENVSEDELVTPGPTLTPVPMNEAHEAEDAAAQGVYYTVNGKYYHASDSCSGMRFAEMHTLADALAAGKQPCPVCLPGREPEQFAVD